MTTPTYSFLNELAGGQLAGVLLQEVTSSPVTPKIVADNGTIIRFETTLQDTKPNRNNRIYTESVLSGGITSPSLQERLRTRTLFGEAGHPFSQDMSRQMQISWNNICHLITSIDGPKNGVVRGCVETTATQMGKDLRGLIVENGSQIAFSMRGAGGVRPAAGAHGKLEVMAPLSILTWDAVTFPSHSSAYMDAVTESYQGIAPIFKSDAVAFAKDQSKNVKALTEQFELDVTQMDLTEDQATLIIRAGSTIVAAFLEEDVRREFRSAIAKL